jgi:hypothetical protein
MTGDWPPVFCCPVPITYGSVIVRTNESVLLKTAKTKALSTLGVLLLAAFIFIKLDIEKQELSYYNQYSKFIKKKIES